MRYPIPFSSFVCLAVLAAIPFSLSASEKSTVSFDPLAQPATSEYTQPTSAQDPAALATTLSWIHDNVPVALPEKTSVAIADRFISELRDRHPEDYDQLLKGTLDADRYRSLLLQVSASKMTDASLASSREALVSKRVEALLRQGGKNTAEAGPSLARVKQSYPGVFRRIVEGRVDDEELVALLSAGRNDSSVEKTPVQAKPKVLSALEIVSEYGRRNQSPGALSKIRSLLLEGTIHASGSPDQRLLVAKLRPDRFRLVLEIDGKPRMLVAFDGSGFWQQAAGKPPASLSPEQAGDLRYLREFFDPLFETDGYSYDRGTDRVVDGHKCYQITVRRKDGSGYTSLIDQESYLEVERETKDGNRIHYSDVREVAGVSIPFREEAVYPDGRNSVLQVEKMIANAGVTETAFLPPLPGDMDVFVLQTVLNEATKGGVTSTSTSAKAN